MEKRRHDVLLLIICFGLGLLAEVSFFHGEIGISYLVFITVFYIVVFFRYRLIFHNRRIGLLLMIGIWLLASTYAFYDNILFRHVNALFIPLLVFFHIVLITSPNNTKWSKPSFFILLLNKFQRGMNYSLRFCKISFRRIFKNMNDQTAQTMKRIMIGLVISIPLLFIITGLLMSADTVFQEVVMTLPSFILEVNFMESVFRFGLVIVIGFMFYGIFKVLHVPSKVKNKTKQLNRRTPPNWDSISAMTILVLLNAVYLLFMVIQFKYFFNEGLLSGYTYAEYARRGFFELIVVTLINWSILISFLKLVREERKGMKLALKLMYSLLVVASTVMLTSAYERLTLYENAYGFTLDRVLAHAVMLFLIVVFGYMFIRIWLEQLSILHFYLIIGLIFYTGINTISLEKIVVNNNLERYEETGKIDIDYLNQLSYTGLDGLIDLYEKDPHFPELKSLLVDRQKDWEDREEKSWQSFNVLKQKVTERMKEFDF